MFGFNSNKQQNELLEQLINKCDVLSNKVDKILDILSNSNDISFPERYQLNKTVKELRRR